MVLAWCWARRIISASVIGVVVVVVDMVNLVVVVMMVGLCDEGFVK